MEIEHKIARCLDNNPYLILNLKQFRALLLDLTLNDIVYTNLVVSSLMDGIHYPISKLKKENQKDIGNIVRSYMTKQSINEKQYDKLLSFYLNVIAERQIPEKETKEQEFDPILNLKTNPIYNKKPPKEVLDYIPCGTTKQDFGFYVKGLKKEKCCTHKNAPIYAVIFSLLQRSLLVEKDSFIKEFENTNSRTLNLSNIYRLEMEVLLLIKNNYTLDNKLNISYLGDPLELECAIKDINYYANVIAKLANIDIEDLELVPNEKPIILSSKENEGTIKLENTSERLTICRYNWLENNLRYFIDESKETYLYTLLSDLFGFNEFLEGQKEALTQILNHPNESNIIILPTGGGKSLIYYFAAMLQSCPTLIISPTKLLISDQLRNMKLYHGIDDTVELTFDMDYKDFEPANKFIFLTPRTCLNRALICKLIKLNFYSRISNVVLDEVHCISNWGHDFRPDYLMLSFNLNEFLDKIGYQCFTATANFTVINDIKEQLKINLNNIYSLANLKNSDFRFNISQKEKESDISIAIADELNTSKDEANLGTKRTIIFTKTQEEGKSVYDALNDDTKLDVDLYNGRYSSYHDFVRGQVNAFIGGEGFGIGINMPRINNIIHYGTPISKSEYAQEIGRAARNKAKSQSSIYYVGKSSLSAIDSKLVDRSITMEELIESDTSLFNEETRATLSKICGNIEEKGVYLHKILSLKSAIDKMSKNGRVSFKLEKEQNIKAELDKITRCLYVLNRVGYLYGWYFEAIDEINNLITFYIDSNKDNVSLDSVVTTTIDYLSSMGSHKKAIAQIKKAKSIEKVIELYIDWYYSQLLYYHREQYIEMLDFLDSYKDKKDDIISSELDQYFSLSILNVYKDSANTKKLSIGQIFDLALSTPSMNVVNSIRLANENEYNAKLDLFLFIYNAKEFGDLDYTRFTRVLLNITEQEKKLLTQNLGTIYNKIEVEEKFKLVDALCKHFEIEKVLTYLYEKTQKDIVYFYVLAKLSNDIMEA